MVEFAIEESMETDVLPPSWFEFLLDRSLLEKHLRQNYPDPSATTLLSQFIVNAEKCAAESGGGSALEEALSNEDPMSLAFRQKKCRAIRLLALQTCAFLNWDLDVLATMHIGTQHDLMKHINVIAKEDQGQDAETSQEFLKVFFHRWVIRTSQIHNLTKTNRCLQQADQFLAFENIFKQLQAEDSVNALKDCITKPELSNIQKIRVPSSKTFEVERRVEWSRGVEIDRTEFNSMIHLDLGIFLLHSGNTPDAMIQFQRQKIPIENFPYLKISKAKLEGYLRAVGLLSTYDQQLEDNKIIPRSLDHERMVEMARLVKKGQTIKLKKMQSLNLDPPPARGHDRLNPDKKDKEDFLISGDNKLGLFSMEKRLVETTNPIEIKELLMKLHTPNPHQTNSTNPVVSFSKLFSGWELPIPVQHATLSIPNGAFQDYIYILVAKSRQLMISLVFSDARKMLLTAKGELQVQLQQSAASGVTPYSYNLSKLAKMMDWEILLMDITQFVTEYPSSSDKNGYSELKSRCKDCLKCAQSPSADVNPRSEIVENILITLINLGEYSYVANFDQMQSQRWPFVEFIALLARVCQDLFLDEKDTSSNYRELWSAVLPIFSSNAIGSGGGGNCKKPISSTITNKPAILSSRSALTWVIDRSCSQPLLSVWVSLLARLHNHILDDVGLQIQAQFLVIWPNILDDVTTPSVIVETKSSRVAGSSKLNSSHIRDFLFTILERGIKIGTGSDVVAWLRCLGDVQLASGAPSLALKCYIEYFAMCTEFFETHNTPPWNDNILFKRMIKCCELLGCFTQAVVLCQFLTEVDYSMAFGMAQEKTTNDSSDSLYGFVWDFTILEFLINLHAKRNEISKRQQAIKVMGLLELNSNNNDEIKREAMCLRKSQFMRTLAKHYIFV